jgi:hypothetical protein
MRVAWDVAAWARSAHHGRVSRTSLTDAIMKLLEAEDAALRGALPDRSLEKPYDQHLVEVKAVFRSHQLVGGRGVNRDALLDRMRDSTLWIDVAGLASRSDAGPRLRHSGDGSRADLPSLTTLITEMFATARTRLEQVWTEASRDGARARQTVVEEWRRRLEYRRGRPTGVERESKVQRVTPTQLVPRAEPETPTKTWVEFQLLDENGKGAAGVAYEITLPDGSTQRGRIGANGAVRFDNIDPGQCQVRFPELDGRDWTPV